MNSIVRGGIILLNILMFVFIGSRTDNALTIGSCVIGMFIGIMGLGFD